MRVAVVGAGGFVGRHLAGRLAAEGWEVIAAGRDPVRLARLLPGFEAMACDLARDEADAWAGRLGGVEALVNCAGLIQDRGGAYSAVHDRGARALFDGARAAGVRRIVQISALGADAGAATSYHLTKRAADDHLASLDGVDWAIVRPSLIVGRGGQSTQLFAALAALPLVPRLGRGDWRLQPIAVGDLVEGIARLLARPGPIRVRIDAVGATAMTTDAITVTFRRWLGLPPARFVPVPRAVIALAARVGAALRLGAASPESLAMLERGNTADPAGFAAACGFTPAALPEALARMPATPADLAAARLLPLGPVLRVLLASVWLAGGLIPLLLTPRAVSFALLARVGLTGAPATVALAGSAALDIAIGAMLLARVRARAAAGVGTVLLLGYSAILALRLPEVWADPFGALVKNAAVLGLSLAVLALEPRHD